jgi:hypothetical protein
MPQVEQELPALPEHLISPLVFSGVPVAQMLTFYGVFVDNCLSFRPFSFVHCIVGLSSISGF